MSFIGLPPGSGGERELAADEQQALARHSANDPGQIARNEALLKSENRRRREGDNGVGGGRGYWVGSSGERRSALNTG